MLASQRSRLQMTSKLGSPGHGKKSPAFPNLRTVVVGGGAAELQTVNRIANLVRGDYLYVRSAFEILEYGGGFLLLKGGGFLLLVCRCSLAHCKLSIIRD